MNFVLDKQELNQLWLDHKSQHTELKSQTFPSNHEQLNLPKDLNVSYLSKIIIFLLSIYNIMYNIAVTTGQYILVKSSLFNIYLLLLVNSLVLSASSTILSPNCLKHQRAVELLQPLAKPLSCGCITCD